jgi:hypothetical protein
MITIYCDFQKTQQIRIDTYTRIVKQVQDYVPLRQYVRRALYDRDHDYKIYVQSRILAEWLRDLHDYPATLVCWTETSSDEPLGAKDEIVLRPEVDSTTAKVVKELAHGDVNVKETDGICTITQPEQVKIISPIITGEGYLLANQSTTLQIVVANSNPFPIYNVCLIASDLQVTIEWPNIEPGSSVGHEILVPATREKGDIQIVDYVCTYEVSSRSYQSNNYLELPIRRLQRNEVDALFEDML